MAITKTYYVLGVTLDTDVSPSTTTELIEPVEAGFITSSIHVTEWTGIWGSNQPGNITYQIIGNKITLSIPRVINTQTTAAFITSVTALPANLRPADDEVSFSHLVQNDTSEIFGAVTISKADGLIRVSFGAPSAPFGTSGLGGWSTTGTVTYFL